VRGEQDTHSKATLSIIDYAAVAEFAAMRGRQLAELTIKSVLVVDKSYQEALMEFRRLAQGHDAVLNIEELESQVPVQEGEAVVLRGYHCIRGTAVTVRRI